MDAIKELTDSMLGQYHKASTIINGILVDAVWNLLMIDRVQQLLTQEDWHKTAYALICSKNILGPPVSVTDEMLVIRNDINWRYIIKRMDPVAVDGIEYVQLVVVSVV